MLSRTASPAFANCLQIWCGEQTAQPSVKETGFRYWFLPKITSRSRSSAGSSGAHPTHYRNITFTCLSNIKNILLYDQEQEIHEHVSGLNISGWTPTVDQETSCEAALESIRHLHRIRPHTCARFVNGKIESVINNNSCKAHLQTAVTCPKVVSKPFCLILKQV